MQQLRLRLKNRAFQYFAAVHTDHSNNRHIHVLLLLKQHRLSKAVLKALRTAATENAKEQRRTLDNVQEAAQTREQGRPLATAQIIFRSQLSRQQRGEEHAIERSGGSQPQNPTCSSCGWTQEMRRLSKTLFHCTSCGRIVADRGLRLEVVREPTLELSRGLEVGAV